MTQSCQRRGPFGTLNSTRLKEARVRTIVTVSETFRGCQVAVRALQDRRELSCDSARHVCSVTGLQIPSDIYKDIVDHLPAESSRFFRHGVHFLEREIFEKDSHIYLFGGNDLYDLLLHFLERRKVWGPVGRAFLVGPGPVCGKWVLQYKETSASSGSGKQHQTILTNKLLSAS